MIVGNEAGIVHRPGEAHRLARKGGIVERGKPGDIGVEARIIYRLGRRPEQGADKPLGPDTLTARFCALLLQGQRDLGDHVLDHDDLHGTLFEDPPDLLDQNAQHVAEAHTLGNELEQPLPHFTAGPGGTRGFVGMAEDVAQIEGKDLRQVMPRALGGEVFMPALSGCDREEPQQAGCLKRGQQFVLAVQRHADKLGLKRLGDVPVGPREQPRRVELRGALEHALYPAGQLDEPRQNVERRPLMARLGERAGLVQPPDRRIQCRHQPRDAGVGVLLWPAGGGRVGHCHQT